MPKACVTPFRNGVVKVAKLRNRKLKSPKNLTVARVGSASKALGQNSKAITTAKTAITRSKIRPSLFRTINKEKRCWNISSAGCLCYPFPYFLNNNIPTARTTTLKTDTTSKSKSAVFILKIFSVHYCLDNKVAGPLGFEPRVSSSAGRCHNPY